MNDAKKYFALLIAAIAAMAACMGAVAAGDESAACDDGCDDLCDLTIPHPHSKDCKDCYDDDCTCPCCDPCDGKGCPQPVKPSLWTFEPMAKTLYIMSLDDTIVWGTLCDVPWHKISEKIEYVVISQGIKKIPNLAFANCVNLKMIMLPFGVTFIGYKAFMNCESLEQIFVPSSVTFVGANAFLDVNPSISVLDNSYMLERELFGLPCTASVVHNSMMSQNDFMEMMYIKINES